MPSSPSLQAWAKTVWPSPLATGISVQSTELAGKRLEVLRDALPNLLRLAIIGDAGYAGSVLEISEVRAAAVFQA